MLIGGRGTPWRACSIHDVAAVRNPASPVQHVASPSPASSGTPLPTRPDSDIEELHKRGIYPITWRVIGGGVMMGGHRKCLALPPRFLPLTPHTYIIGEVCVQYLDGTCTDGDDCRFSHVTDSAPSAVAHDCPQIDHEPVPCASEVVPPQPAAEHDAVVVPAMENTVKQNRRASMLSVSIPVRPTTLPEPASPAADTNHLRVFDSGPHDVPMRPYSTPPCLPPKTPCASAAASSKQC